MPFLLRQSNRATFSAWRRASVWKWAMTMDLLQARWLTTEELAGKLGVDSSTLRRWRTMMPPQGPPFGKISERVTMYHVQDVENWLNSRRITPGEVAP